MRSAIGLVVSAWLICSCSVLVDTSGHEFSDNTGRNGIGSSGHGGSGHAKDGGAEDGATAMATDAAAHDGGDAALDSGSDAACTNMSAAGCAPAPGVKCRDVDCGQGRDCVQDSAGPRCACKPGEGWDVVHHACVICDSIPRCKSTGYSGALLVRGPNDARCECETRPGFFYNARTASATACDADGDGFTNLEAASAAAASDAVVRDNARCTVRRVQALVLQNEAGGTHSVDLTDAFAAGLPLYESPRDDGAKDAAGLARYQIGTGRTLAPREVNAFTKACVSPGADVNDNGVPDVDEWSGSTLDPARYAADAELLSAYRKYVEFGYFFELHDGWYEAPTKKRATAIYRIVEKTRDAGDADHVAVRYPDGTDKYVYACARHVDALYSGDSPNTIGGDFSAYGDDAVMTHHSQFKCLRIVSESAYNQASSDEASAPQRAYFKAGALVRKAAGGSAQSYAWTVNDCYADSGAESPPRAAEMINPRFAHVKCTPNDAPALDTVRWAAVTYAPYSQAYTSYFDKGGYLRGCANQCLEQLDPKPIAADCMSCTTGDQGQGKLSPDAAGGDCGGGQVCDGAGSCGDCVPAWTSCAPVGDVARVCGDDGHWLTKATCAGSDQVCGGGACGACSAPAQDCNESSSDGCEVDVMDGAPQHCGACNLVCSSVHISAQCVGGNCGGQCDVGWGDCNNDKRSDGCEYDVSADFQNCGSCGGACNQTHDRCENSTCQGCAASLENCDLSPANGCEVNVAQDPNNCGFCGDVCAGNEFCNGGVCTPIVICSASHVGARHASRVTFGACAVLLVMLALSARRSRRRVPTA